MLTNSHGSIPKISNIGQLEYHQKIQDFSANLQKGDLGLSMLILYGFVLYGQTKTGKTVTGHILCGNPLKGQKKDGEDVVQATTSRNRKAKIGNQGNSQTQIPNFFEVKLKNNKYSDYKMFVIDTPGYGDSNGVLKILSNGYYHYRLYSKVQNMKFILCFDRKDISNTAEKFIDTIKQFTSYFKNYLDNKQQIWKSCAFLITKVQQTQNTLKDLQQKFQNLIKNLNTQLLPKQEEALKQLVRHVIKEKKIFYIKRFKKGQSTDCKGLLQNIDQRIPEWYGRNYDQVNKQINMAPIEFSLAKEIILDTTRYESSRLQFVQLVEYYNLRIKQFISPKQNDQQIKKKGSLGYVIKQIVKDAMGSPDSHQFLDIMQSYVELYYGKYDPLYAAEREKREKQLFSLSNQKKQLQHNSVKAKKLNQKNYVVKKFQALYEIQRLKQQINNSPQRDRMEWLRSCESNLYDIIKELNKISFKRTKSLEVIYKYGYLIHRIVEEAKVFTLLIQVYAPKDIRQKIIDMCGSKFIELKVQLKDFMGVQFSYNQTELSTFNLHYMYVKGFDQQKINKKITINQSLIEFFSRIKIDDQQVVKKIINLIKQYSQKILLQIQDKQQVNLQQKQRLIKRLAVSRINSEQLFFQSQEEQKIRLAMMIRSITGNLGKLLQYSGRFQLARKVYNTIRFVQSCCRMYKLQIQANSKDIKLRIDFGKYLADHFRQHQAIELLQQTYEIATSANDLKLVKQQISDLRIKVRQHAINGYQQSLFNEQYFVQFTQQLQDELTI